MIGQRIIAVALLPLACIAQQIPIVGIPTSNGQAPPPRKNINDFHSQGGPEWDLFILGLASLQEQSETDPLSYFQLMGTLAPLTSHWRSVYVTEFANPLRLLGIHGAPYKSWNGVEGVKAGGYGGYCCHGDVCFGLWHRPFLSLYEQTLNTHVQRIASNYRGQNAAAYQAAAQRVRFPYWDWAVDAKLPPSVTMKTISVTTPQGKQTVRNPLYSYKFRRPFSELGMPNDSIAARFTETKRAPQDNGSENIDGINAELERYGGTLRSQVYNVFSQTITFEQMATDSFPGSSFESPHNTVHNIAGSGGHLMWLDWSAFDPAFALHHCNVDRLVALWQTINHETTVFNGSVRTNGQFATAPGSFTADSPLKPFYASTRPGDFHTTRTVADITRLGYTYPELLPPAGEAVATREDLGRLVSSRVNALYGSGVVVAQSEDAPTGTSRSVRRRRSDAGGADGIGIPDRKMRNGRARNKDRTGARRDYQLLVKATRELLELPCRIHVFVGDQPVGQVSLMASPTSGLSFTVLPLAEVLAERGIDDWSEYAVLPMLEKELKVEVRKYDGTKISARSVPGLDLEVQSRTYTPKKNNYEFPKFHTPKKVAMPVAML
ncbi:hypothetical protein PpBr36_08557 [Pyricularia pennisetigena]|uniref:hypothetical protein n=1 Tax=Pyricularia pennisetigena TaxID=1578925 RepID=UPI0011507366|nr:hypothetical protein PpBr36_08557 [Pyricularia pennisetigena]TLS24934.1 hypothetical protein PpBr36_08557 [Pyricularia pennisetigena]